MDFLQQMYDLKNVYSAFGTGFFLNLYILSKYNVLKIICQISNMSTSVYPMVSWR